MIYNDKYRTHFFSKDQRKKSIRKHTLVGSFIGIGICLLFFALCFYSYLDMQNSLTKLRIEVPKLVGRLRQVQEENVRLKYAIVEFENPQRLMQLAKSTSFSHLKFPLVREVIVLPVDPMTRSFEQKQQAFSTHPHIAIASRQP